MLQSNRLKAYLPNFQFMGFFRESPAIHLHLIQLLTFLYVAYRFLSRDYTVYGLLDESLMTFSRPAIGGYWPFPPTYFTTFQFIYEFIPLPGTMVLKWLQVGVIGSAVLGLIGIVPRFAALVCFLIIAHITGLMNATNSELDGGTIMLCSLLVLALCDRGSLYRTGNAFSKKLRGVQYHWPVVLLFFLVGSFYTYGGLNKLLDYGLLWPFELDLENLAKVALTKAAFVTSRYSHSWVSAQHLSPLWSDIGGMITLFGELFFVTVVCWPRMRLFFVVSMISLHCLVLLMAGINFVGSSLILLLCLDWNLPWRKLRVYNLQKNSAFFLQNASVEQGKSSSSVLEAEDEQGTRYKGLEVIEQISARSLALLPIYLLMQIPGVFLLIRRFQQKRT